MPKKVLKVSSIRLCEMIGCYELANDNGYCWQCSDHIENKMNGVSGTIRPNEKLISILWKFMPKDDNGSCITSIGAYDKKQFQEIAKRYFNQFIT